MNEYTYQELTVINLSDALIPNGQKLLAIWGKYQTETGEKEGYIAHHWTMPTNEEDKTMNDNTSHPVSEKIFKMFQEAAKPSPDWKMISEGIIRNKAYLHPGAEKILMMFKTKTGKSLQEWQKALVLKLVEAALENHDSAAWQRIAEEFTKGTN